MADLIQYIYRTRVVIHWDSNDTTLDFCDYLLRDLSKSYEYRSFIVEASKMSGQNCLNDYMTEYCIKFDKGWIQSFLKEKEMSSLISESIVYHSIGTMHMKLHGLDHNIKCSKEELAKIIIVNRHNGISPLVWENPKDSPYEIALNKINKILDTNK